MISDVSDLIRASGQTAMRYRTGTTAKASLITGTLLATNRITWTAKIAGEDGNSITVALINPGTANHSTAVSLCGLVGRDLVVTLSTNASKAITATASSVAAAIAGNVGASTLLTATATETGIVAAVTATNLDGGVGNSFFGGDGNTHTDAAEPFPLEFVPLKPIDLTQKIDATASIMSDQDIVAEDQIECDGVRWRVQSVDYERCFGVVTHKTIKLVRIHL